VAPHDWRVLVDHLSRAGFSDKELLAAGLAKDGPKGIYDTFRARVMFPIADSSGRVIAFSGRTLESDAPIAKYLNSPETALFSKSKVLYGLDRAKKTIRLSDQAVLVEGQMDLLMAHQAGTQNAVASSGTALTRDHLELIGRLTRRLVLAFDADGAGVSAALRSATMALSMGFEVRVAGLPPGEDPASLIISRPDVWHAAIKDALPLIDFYLARVMSGKADLRVRGRLIAKDVLPYVAVLDSSIEQSHYIKKISDILGVREESAWEDLAKVPREIDLVSNNQTIGKDSSVSSLKTSARKSLIGKKLLGIMYWRGSLSPPDSVSKDIARRLTEIIGSKRFTEIDDFYQKKRADLILEAELSFSESQPLSKSVAELFREFEKEFLQDELRVKMDELSLAEREKNHDRAFSILKQCQTISSKINALASMNI
jgi:DNA primase